MARDRKANVWQKTPGELKRMYVLTLSLARCEMLTCFDLIGSTKLEDSRNYERQLKYRSLASCTLRIRRSLPCLFSLYVVMAAFHVLEFGVFGRLGAIGGMSRVHCRSEWSCAYGKLQVLLSCERGGGIKRGTKSDGGKLHAKKEVGRGRAARVYLHRVNSCSAIVARSR